LREAVALAAAATGLSSALKIALAAGASGRGGGGAGGVDGLDIEGEVERPVALEPQAAS
jgi:hypothetical protein